ncbi:MAG: GNAT family N-acetyltransferase [Caldilineaceae bacterium]|nr:GNAT family N-acetyltransferase [Caldilineaceae bacterium]MBP8110470.1 GNAT family N-acetyltransferase [Caldilineaceae bacterium]MBP8125503.1 GNAT family N-acetyltransferase [Caldilineaceae bacterium]MBP9074984.1 GNAT family N-acetyltransferase [Caldilineaceae bacterium]
MIFTFRPFTADDARTMLSWRYPPPLDLYNINADTPTPASLDADVAYLLSPAFHYHAALDATGHMMGFCCFGEDAQVPGGDYSRPALDIGLSLRPSLIGQGLGNNFLAAILDLGRELLHPVHFRATVVDFNPRSRRLFEKAGFRQTQTFHPPDRPQLTFVVLEREGEK